MLNISVLYISEITNNSPCTKNILNLFDTEKNIFTEKFLNSQKFRGNPREIPKIEKVPAGTRARLGCPCLGGGGVASGGPPPPFY